MKISLLYVGKANEPETGSLVTAYLKRAQPLFQTSLVAVKPFAVRNPHQIDTARAREAERLLAKVPSGVAVVALDVTGTALDSEQFAARLDRHRLSGQGLAFVIGGAYGLAPEVLSRAEWRLSLSPMTLPHRLAQLLLAEQLYRAKTLLAGEPYHK